MATLKIGEKMVGDHHKPYFIADIAANHDGDLQRAFKLIELAKQAGADAAKFQNFKAHSIISKSGSESFGKNLAHQASWKKTVYEIYEEASIDENWTERLKEKCDEIGIEYMTSPYEFEAVDLVNPYVNAYKVGSGDITWTESIAYIAKKNKPVILATGASELEDVVRAMRVIQALNPHIVLMQCNTNYSASDENLKYINLQVLKTYKSLFPDVVLGLSDHTFGHVTVLGAIALGAHVIEKHFTDDNHRLGPDHKFSMNPTTWREMVDRSIELWYALGDGVKKIEANEIDAAVVQRRSLYLARDIQAGTILSREDIIPLRPYNRESYHPHEIDQVIGKKITQNLKKDSSILRKDIAES